MVLLLRIALVGGLCLGLAACGQPTASQAQNRAASPAPAATAAPENGRVAGRPDAPPCLQNLQVMDADGDGTVSLSEYLAAQEGRTFIIAPEDAFKAQDRNGDGRLDESEFCS